MVHINMTIEDHEAEALLAVLGLAEAMDTGPAGFICELYKHLASAGVQNREHLYFDEDEGFDILPLKRSWPEEDKRFISISKY